MAASLIAISLVLMIMRGMAALLKAGSDSKTSKDDDPRPEDAVSGTQTETH